MESDVIVVGNGRLAKAILTYAEEEHLPNETYPYNVLHWNGDITSTAKLARQILVHVGSGWQYHETLEYADEHQSIYIQAATKNRIEMAISEKPSFTFINAPNLSILMAKAIYLTKILRQLFENNKKELSESHQADKKSIAGTASKMAEYLGINEKNIEKIRNKRVQSEELKISNLEKHAYHRIRIYEAEDSIEITTKIEGLRAYVTGLFRISRAALTLEAGTYEIEDLIEKEKLQNGRSGECNITMDTTRLRRAGSS